MQIFLVDLADSTALTLDVESIFPVEKVKYKYLTLREKEKTMQSIKLLYKGEELKDDHTLGDFNVKSSSAILVEYSTNLQTASFETPASQTTALQTMATQITASQTMPSQTTALQTMATQITASQTPTFARIKIKFQIVTLEGKTINISAFTDSTVLKVSEAIFKTEGIPLKQQRLVFKGKQMDKTRTLDEEGVGEGDKICLVLHLSGS